MVKHQVRLLVLIALGAGAVMPALPSLDCGLPMPENLRFGGIEVTIPGSGLVYHRVTVTDFHLQFAMNTSVSLFGGSVLECAKAVASAGFEAFSFDWGCTGYRLNLHFLACQTGDVVLYVREDYLDGEPVVAPMAEAPYMVIPNGAFTPYRVYMLSDLVEADNQYLFWKIEKFEAYMVTSFSSNVIFRENGDIFSGSMWLLDVNSCLNHGAYGLQVAVNAELYDYTWPIVYFFEECGNTVRVPKSEAEYKMFVFSHPGLGCKYYPSGLPDECTVTFVSENSTPMKATFGFIFAVTDNDDGGLIMTITGSTETGKTKTEKMDQSHFYNTIHDKTTFEVSMQHQPSKRAIGFFIFFQ